jgi:hypothetical protein
MKDLMKQSINILLAAAIAFIAAVGCEKPETPVVDDPQVEVPEQKEALGYFNYDGKDIPVYSISATADESQIFFKISPIEDVDRQTTYAIVGINAALEGAEIDVENAWYNDDYYFIYEDPVMYYSQYRKLTSGTIYIKRNGDGPEDYEVYVDVVLPDGKKFHFKQI